MTSDNVRYVWPAAKAVRASNGASGGQMAADPERYVGPDDELRDLSDRFETAVERSQGAGRTLDALGFAGVGAPLRASFETDAEEDARADGRITPAGSPRYVDAAAENAQVRQRSGIDGPDRYVPVEWAPCELAGGFCILIAGHGGPCARAHDGPAPSHGGHCYSSGGTLVCGWPQFHARAIRSGAHL